MRGYVDAIWHIAPLGQENNVHGHAFCGAAGKPTLKFLSALVAVEYGDENLPYGGKLCLRCKSGAREAKAAIPRAS